MSRLLLGLLFGFAASTSLRAESKEAYPRHILSSSQLKLMIFLPAGDKSYYQGTRFDWSGLVSQVEYRGHQFYGPWKTTHDVHSHEDADGTAEEFGIVSPPSYKEANTGETFIKIGVGVLEKPQEDSYGFWKAYKIIQPGTWKIEVATDSITFRQTLNGPRGWAYEYTKRILLEKDRPTFKIEHMLKNSGTQLIDTEHYCHNFTIIDKAPAGPDYEVEFGFDPVEKEPLTDIAKLIGRKLVFSSIIPVNKSVYTELRPRAASENKHAINIRNKKTGAGVHIQGDTPLTHCNVWSARSVVCPEPFVAIHVQPGQEVHWSSTYTFFADK